MREPYPNTSEASTASLYKRINLVKRYVALQRYPLMAAQQSLDRLLAVSHIHTEDDLKEDSEISSYLAQIEEESGIEGFLVSVFAPWQQFSSYEHDEYGDSVVIVELANKLLAGKIMGLTAQSLDGSDRIVLGLKIHTSIIFEGEEMYGWIFSPLEGSSITFNIPDFN